MKPEPPAGKVVLYPGPPISDHGVVIVEEGEVIDIAHIGRTQHFGHEVIQAVEIEIGKKLAGQIANRQAAAAPKGSKEIIAIEIQLDGSCGFERSTIVSISARVRAHAIRRRNSALRIAWSMAGK
jgi:hypothetical protein